MYERPYYFDPFQNGQPNQAGGPVPPQGNPAGGQPQQNGAYGTQPQEQQPYTGQSADQQAGSPYQAQPPYQQSGPTYQAQPNTNYYGSPVYHYSPYSAPQAPVLDEKAMRRIAKANQERKQIVKQGNVGGAVMLFVFLFSAIFSILLSQTPLGDLQSASTFAESGIYIFFSILCVGGAALLATVKTRRDCGRPVLPAAKVSITDSAVYIVVGFACCLLASMVTGIFINIIGLFGLEVSLGDSAPVQTVPALLMSLVATAVIPAVVEECSFRGAIMQPLRSHGEKTAIIISGLLFGLFHGNLQQIPFAFIVGLVLGFVTIKTGSIIPAMIIHFVNNGNSILMNYLMDRYGNSVGNTAYYMVMAVVLILAIVLVLFMYLKGRGDLFRVEEPRQTQPEPYALTTGQKVRAYFSAPCMIAAWIVIAIQIISTTRLTWFH